MTTTIIAFLLCLASFVLIGVLSHRHARSSSSDYLMASSSVKPWLAGLSAVATNNSGYMFIGVIGYTYTTGLPAVWLMVGWLLGDFIMSSFIHRRLRERTANTGQNTFPGVLANWYGIDFRTYRRLAGLICFIFLGAYAAAQLNAGSKALHVLFDWPLWAGAVIGAVIVIAYCFAGGIRAAIWTDAAQAIVMIVAMFLMLWVAVDHLGGFGVTWQKLNQVSPDYMDLWPGAVAGLASPWGPALFIVGWLFAGFSVIGQPHIMIRFMSLDSAASTNRARVYYYSWYVVFYLVANSVGLLSRLLIPETEAFDPELALPTLAVQLLPPVLVGVVLAGVFAATISTGDSLVLACSAAVTEDAMGKTQKLWQVKMATVSVVALALGIALAGPQNVFDLVVVSWGVLGASFAPLLLVYVVGYRPSEGLAIAMVIAALVAVYGWTRISLLAEYYEGMFGIIVALAVFALGRMFGFCGSRQRY